MMINFALKRRFRVAAEDTMTAALAITINVNMCNHPTAGVVSILSTTFTRGSKTKK